MHFRSFLFTPADQPHKVRRASESGADTIILDLEDSVAPDRKPDARTKIQGYLQPAQGAGSPALWVRINALSTGMTEQDIAATNGTPPAGYVLPKCESVDDIEAVARMIARYHGNESVGILAIATETVRAVRNLMRHSWAHPLLRGLAWGGEDLLADIGGIRNRTPVGGYMPPYLLARDLTLFAALDAGVAPVDAVYTDFRDLEGLSAESVLANELGFTGKMAIHPRQIEPIHAAFSATAEQLEWVNDVLAAFRGAEGGVTSLNGEMLDAPHYRRARRLLRLS